MASTSGPGYLPHSTREALLWLILVLIGAFVGRFLVVHAHRIANGR
jgi:hypothetical protein